MKKTTKRKAKPAAVSFEPLLMKHLADKDSAITYLNACLDEDDGEEGLDVFFAALNDIVKARGVQKVASETGSTRDGIYKILTGHKNPTIRKFRDLLHSLDFEIAVVQRK